MDAVLNAEYRVPPFDPQRGWRSFPLFLQHFSQRGDTRVCFRFGLAF
jgi:hypothetical protein